MENSMSYQFKPEKTVASIGYLVQQTEADLYSVMKMLYLADKAHLGSFGRTITGDDYTAMEKGPLPERAYNLCKFVRGTRESFAPMPAAKDFLAINGNAFVLLSDPDLAELSRSDLESLDQAAAMHRAGGWKALFDASHDDAWKAAWDEARDRGVGSIGMDIVDIARSAGDETLADFVRDPHPGAAPAYRD